MALQVAYFSSSTTTGLIERVNDFIAAQPLTLFVDQFNIVAKDLARYAGTEIRASLVYDPDEGDVLAEPLRLESYEAERLPVLQEEVNDALDAAPAEMWVALPLAVLDTARRLPGNWAVFWRNADPAAVGNIRGA